jgi:hypothetical protein
MIKSLQTEYLPSKLTSEDYPNLIASGAVVDYDCRRGRSWRPTTGPPTTTAIVRLALLVESLFTKLPQLQKPPFHPKGKELSPRSARRWLDAF